MEEQRDGYSIIERARATDSDLTRVETRAHTQNRTFAVGTMVIALPHPAAPTDAYAA